MLLRPSSISSIMMILDESTRKRFCFELYLFVALDFCFC